MKFLWDHLKILYEMKVGMKRCKRRASPYTHTHTPYTPERNHCTGRGRGRIKKPAREAEGETPEVGQDPGECRAEVAGLTQLMEGVVKY